MKIHYNVLIFQNDIPDYLAYADNMNFSNIGPMTTMYL
jgi:hypothetical protein